MKNINRYNLLTCMVTLFWCFTFFGAGPVTMLETIPKLQEIDEDETPIPGATLPQNQHELIYISVGPNDFAEIDELLGISSYNRRQRSKACVFY